MRYLVVGTGPSVKELDFSQIKLRPNVIVLSVNTSILFLPYADIWFSIDHSNRNVECARVAQKRAIPVVWALSKKGRSSLVVTGKNYFFMNKIEKKSYSKKTPKTDKDWFDRWKCVYGFSDMPPNINTGNSLFSAVNLAYLDNPEMIGILGLDGNSEPSHGGNHKPNNLSHLPMLFASAVPQLEKKGIQVKNGSKNSAVTCFERCTPKELIKWINSE